MQYGTIGLICMVKYVMKTKTEGVRQPVFKGMIVDKMLEDSIDN